MFLFVLINVILKIALHETGHTKFFLIYLTNWALVVLLSYQLCDLILVCVELYKRRKYGEFVRE